MTITITCASCQCPLVLPVTAAGQRVQCPACRITFTADGPQPIANDFLAPLRPRGEDLPATKPAPASDWRAKDRRDGRRREREEEPRRELPRPRKHRYLLLLALLPLGLTLGTLGQPGWMLAGVVLTALGFGLALVQSWKPGARLAGVLGLAGVAYLLLFFSLVLSLGLGGRIDPKAWKPFEPPGTRCRVLLPGEPTRKAERLPQGGEFVTHSVMKLIQGRVFAIGHCTLPGQDVPLDLVFDEARNGMIKNMPGAVLESQRDVAIEGYSGREALLDYRGQGKVIFRLYLVEEHLYLLLAGGPGYSPDSPDVVKFFDSFELKGDSRKWTPWDGAADPDPPRPPGANPQVWLKRTLPAKGKEHVWCAAFSPDGQALAVGEGDREGRHHLVVWETGTKAIRTSFLNELPIRSVQALAFAPDGQRLAAGTDDGKVHVWRWPAGADRATFTGHAKAVQALAFSPDSKTLASQSGDVLILRDVQTGAEKARRPGEQRRLGEGVRPALAFSPDGATLASAVSDQHVVLYDAVTGVERSRFLAHGAGVTALTFSPDGVHLVTGGNDGQVLLWTAAGQPVQTTVAGIFKKQVALANLGGRGVRGLALRRDGKVLAVGGDQASVLVDVAGRKQLSRLPAGQQVWSVAFAPDGKTLAAAGFEGSTYLFDTSELDRLLPKAP